MSAVPRILGRTRKPAGREPLDAQGVDLLVHGHRAERRGEGGAGAARHDDAGHQRAELARDADPHEVRDVEHRTELAQLDRADEGEHRADENADQRDDAEGTQGRWSRRPS